MAQKLRHAIVDQGVNQQFLLTKVLISITDSSAEIDWPVWRGAAEFALSENIEVCL